MPCYRIGSVSRIPTNDGSTTRRSLCQGPAAKAGVRATCRRAASTVGYEPKRRVLSPDASVVSLALRRDYPGSLSSRSPSFSLESPMVCLPVPWTSLVWPWAWCCSSPIGRPRLAVHVLRRRRRSPQCGHGSDRCGHSSVSPPDLRRELTGAPIVPCVCRDGPSRCAAPY